MDKTHIPAGRLTILILCGAYYVGNYNLREFMCSITLFCLEAHVMFQSSLTFDFCSLSATSCMIQTKPLRKKYRCPT